MKTIYFVLNLLVFALTSHATFGQCLTGCTCTCPTCNTCTSCSTTPIGGSCFFTVAAGNTVSTNYTLSSTRTLCVYGTYTGTVTMNGGSVLVYSGGNFKPAGMSFLTSGVGTIEVKSGGSATLPTSVSAFWGDLTINNCGSLTTSSDITGANNGHNLIVNNSGTFTSTADITLTNGSSAVTSYLYNCGTMTAANISASGSGASTLTVSNSGSLTLSGSASFGASSSTETLKNCGTFKSAGINNTAGNFNLSNSSSMTLTGTLLVNGSQTVNFNNCSSSTTTSLSAITFNGTGAQNINTCSPVTSGTITYNGTGSMCNGSTWTSSGNMLYNGSGALTNNGTMNFVNITLNGVSPAAIYNNGKIYASGNFIQNSTSPITLCQSSYIGITGSWTSNGGLTTGVSQCAAISVGQTSTCNGCTFTGYTDLCDKSNPAPNNGPVYVDVNNAGTWGSNVTYCNCYVLPIKLLYFDGNVEGKKVKLSWATATETNNDYFTVERSMDGKNYEEIAIVGGAGNSSTTLEYSVIDNQPLEGKSFYRLTQTDFDGQYTRSHPIAIDLKNIALMLHPNPVTDLLQCSVFCDAVDYGLFSVMDASGKRLNSRELFLEKGTTKITFDASSLAPGLYIVQVQTPHSTVFEKFVK